MTTGVGVGEEDGEGEAVEEALLVALTVPVVLLVTVTVVVGLLVGLPLLVKDAAVEEVCESVTNPLPVSGTEPLAYEVSEAVPHTDAVPELDGDEVVVTLCVSVAEAAGVPNSEAPPVGVRVEVSIHVALLVPEPEGDSVIVTVTYSASASLCRRLRLLVWENQRGSMSHCSCPSSSQSES